MFANYDGVLGRFEEALLRNLSGTRKSGVAVRRLLVWPEAEYGHAAP